MLNRGYSKVLIWNDSIFNMAPPTSSPHQSMRVRSVSQADATNMQIVMGNLTSAANSGTAPASQTQKTVFSVYAKHLHAIVHYLEVRRICDMACLWHADPYACRCSRICLVLQTLVSASSFTFSCLHWQCWRHCSYQSFRYVIHFAAFWLIWCNV